jgi:predicted Zn-dependent protease
MTDNARLDDLRRRIQKDPASIAFAQLAEELRRAGQSEEAVHVCRSGLATYPDYVSARVTLGRALISLNQLDDAERELEAVRTLTPENLAAARALEELRARRTAAAAPASHLPAPGPLADASATPEQTTIDGAEYIRIVRTLAALESWLAAIYVTRAERRA